MDWKRHPVETYIQVDFHSHPEQNEPMLEVNFGFGRILERVVSKAEVEIGQWSSLWEKNCYSVKAFIIFWY